MKAILSGEEIFISGNNQIDSDSHEIAYQKDSQENQNQYLSQFLNSEASENSTIHNAPKSEQLRLSSTIMTNQNETYSLDEKKTKFKAKKREKSCFHNFQKHLVITLRNMIKIKKCSEDKQIETIAFEMWSVFVKSKLYSKKYLHVLFGVFAKNQENEFSKKFLNELGFMGIFAKYSEESIKKAQNYLRREIIQQLQNINMREYLTYRKLKRIEEFLTYIQEFMGQLKEGSVRRRLPKDRKILMAILQKENMSSPQTTE